jgi:nucleoside-diphosphate-sugar epimerase
MRVLVVGASGAIGQRLIPRLTERGHQVTGTSRSAARAGQLRALGAEPAVLDVLDEGAVRAVVGQARPDAVIYQATALTGVSFSRNMDRTFAPTNELRTRGTDILLAAVSEAGVPRFIGQSFAPFRYAHAGGPVKDEGDPLVAAPPPSARLSFGAMAHVDTAVTAAGGIALRYGGFYGEQGDAMVKAVRKRQFPLIGDGGGIMSFIHLEDAAAATVLALDAEGPAVFNVTDDEPAPMRDWLPALAAAVGAKPPHRLPGWAGALAMGKTLTMMTEARGASNAKAKKELGWVLRYPSWRAGFPAAYGRSPAPTGRARRAG